MTIPELHDPNPLIRRIAELHDDGTIPEWAAQQLDELARAAMETQPITIVTKEPADRFAFISPEASAIASLQQNQFHAALERRLIEIATDASAQERARRIDQANCLLNRVMRGGLTIDEQNEIIAAALTEAKRQGAEEIREWLRPTHSV